MKDLQGRTALVTGASGGIGRHIASALAAAGVNVVLTGRNPDALRAAAADCERHGVRVASIVADLGERSGVEMLTAEAERAAGPIELLINNAGIGAERMRAFTDTSLDDLDRVIEVNLRVPMQLTRAFVPGMVERGGGHVVQITSMAGRFGLFGTAPYSASKAGLALFSAALRAEYRGSPIGFSVVCPGFVDEAGMYAREMVSRGVRANAMIGTAKPEAVAKAVLDAIRRNRAEVIVNSVPVRPLLAISALSPGLGERMVDRTGANALMRQAVEAKQQEPSTSAAGSP